MLRIAVLLCLAVGMSSGSCPAEEDLFPCQCEDDDGGVIVTCSGRGIRQPDIERALGRMEGERIEALELFDLDDLGKLKGDLFSGHHIRRLEMSHCELEALTDGGKPALSGLEDSLEELTISGSLSGEAPPRLGHLRALRELDLSHNELRRLQEGGLPGSLEWLSVSNNGIEGVADGALANLAKLRTLWLDGNPLGVFRRNWLPDPAAELKDLELDNNDLDELPPDALSGMPALETLSLRTNSLRTLDRDTWAGAWPQLRRIDLRGNPLECDSRMEWMRGAQQGAALFGECHAPSDQADVELQDWIGGGPGL